MTQLGWPMWLFEVKENLHFDLLQLLHLNSDYDKTWNKNLRDSQLLIICDISWNNPMIKFV